MRTLTEELCLGLALALAIVLSGCTCDDSEPADAAPMADACNPFHEGCAGCGEEGHSCCVVPAFGCAEGLACDQLSDVCIKLCGGVGEPCCTADPLHPCDPGLTCGVPPQDHCIPVDGQ